jgi:hypothetical protein
MGLVRADEMEGKNQRRWIAPPFIPLTLLRHSRACVHIFSLAGLYTRHLIIENGTAPETFSLSLPVFESKLRLPPHVLYDPPPLSILFRRVPGESLFIPRSPHTQRPIRAADRSIDSGERRCWMQNQAPIYTSTSSADRFAILSSSYQMLDRIERIWRHWELERKFGHLPSHPPK